MIIINLDENKYILRIEPKEELFSSLLEFVQKNKIKSGFFYGMGACKSCVIGRYSNKNKNYYWKKINSQMEVGSLIGNLTIKENNPYFHIHAVLGDRNLKAISGHLSKLIVFPTCEIIFFKFNKIIKRKYNKLTNLFLIE